MGERRNRLAHESSPYLLLHADNPVDWYPWGEEAFDRARREDKPIFLSVGYSTCYWCHVMERESFAKPEIARLLNDGFVAIKVDREERPDLDEIYMAATQLLTNSGGWPNSLFLTHGLEPFFAGTYFPPEDRHGRPGFPRVLASVREAWENRRDGVLRQGEAVAGAMREQMGARLGPPGRVPGPEAVAATLAVLARRFDPEWGGFGGAPKFPSPGNLFFLLERAREGEAEARQMLVATLDRMARGGIHDQLAGGFHRYSTDAEWLVPHFEKMLYDNASLAPLYAEAASLTTAEGFERVARGSLEFVLRELTGAEGGFLSAVDAETDGAEGAYYTWTREELKQIIDGPSFELLALVYGFEGRPNFEGERYVLHLPVPLGDRARTLGITVEDLVRRLEPGRRALLDAREERKRPLVDDKVLADWNGLMIAGMARTGRFLGEPRYVDAAGRAAAFVLSRLVAADSETPTLLHAYRAGAAKVSALLDDYAFLIHGLLELHESTREERWLREALRLQGEQDRRLWDETSGGYFSAGEDPRLLLRAKTAYDGAVASGNGMAALNLLELAHRTGNAAFRSRAEEAVAAFGEAIEEHSLAHVTLVRAVARMVEGSLSSSSNAAPEPPSSLEETAETVVDARGRLDPRATGPWRPFTLDLVIRPGWHVNANPASHPFLVATEVQSGSGALRRLRYPDGAPLRSDAAPDAISVYSGRVRIEGEVEVKNGPAVRVRIVYQPCDASRCLPAVTREVPLR